MGFSELFMEVTLEQFWMNWISLPLLGNIYDNVNYHNEGSQISRNRALTASLSVSWAPCGHVQHCILACISFGMGILNYPTRIPARESCWRESIVLDRLMMWFDTGMLILTREWTHVFDSDTSYLKENMIQMMTYLMLGTEQGFRYRFYEWMNEWMNK